MPRKLSDYPLLIIGGAEWIALPQLGIPQLRARIDTGAHSSSLHTQEQEEFDREGESWVRFVVSATRKRSRGEWTCEAPISDRRLVKNTSGEAEERIVIRTGLQLGSMVWPADINLTNRENMRYRFLVGRSVMTDRVLVNPSHAYLHGRPRQY